MGALTGKEFVRATETMSQQIGLHAYADYDSNRGHLAF